ncbi:glycosyltransferase [Pontimicrobium aquaticum]|uniref:Glycosyltransferase n=1 Tax=Pontimicrobium aquaticum TaxID=2565367 RepID=A0A4U0EW04_9FLAO|nr:glycosyltransferase [Pontimicrobium aquaticum]TJY36075.1 glycosyltransferase [Pontimicrobium aquaticum]
MTASDISFIIPIFNRPEEAKELLESFIALDGEKDFEIVIIEDGSKITSKAVVENYTHQLNISYYFKENSGPGDSRNYGMKRAKGNYFIILDSDCVLPNQYLQKVLESLNNSYVDCFGGPDAAHSSFSNIQKAINFAMTSFITTGGIRGKAFSINKFQPRSFNMGLSKKAFEATKGFGRIHPGEDPDLSIRLWKLGFETKLIQEAFVYHKRRISWSKFYKQVYKFGSVRPILNVWHPDTKKITYWFPSLFCIGFVLSIIALFFNVTLPIYLVFAYFALSFTLAIISTKNIVVALLSLLAIGIQFYGYGKGFLTSTLKLMFSKKNAEMLFPNLFFKS